MAITLTPKAIGQVRKLMEKQQAPEGAGVRLAAKGGGCSGFSYVLEIDAAGPRPTDKVMEQEGLKVLCDPKSYLYLNGMVVDFQDSLMKTGFTFKNPNAQKTCGCGESFSV